MAPTVVGTELERAQFRVDALRTGLSIGAGLGAAGLLLLALRRQQLAERSQQATEYDAGEKRVTELYVKAAEQLGSVKAPVRLAGLYALERLAQDNPVHRQTIVDVICAYLRMPYQPPTAAPPKQADADVPTAEDLAGVAVTVRAAAPAGTVATNDAREERQVRLTAQRILSRHLRQNPTAPQGQEPDNPAYWKDIDLDLTEAVLLGWDFTDCRPRRALFRGATFAGNATFERATFTGDAGFGGATFNGDATFERATFTGTAGFGGAAFTGDAWFDSAAFTGGVGFGEAVFTGGAAFIGASFIGEAWFEEATFDAATFDRAIFTGDAWFKEATFIGGAWFHGATLARRDGRNDVWPTGWGPDASGLLLVEIPELATAASLAG